MEYLMGNEVELATEIVNDVMPWAVLIVAGVIGLWIKDFISNLVAAINWKLKKGFEPGDVVYLDGELVTIVSIGVRETIFEIDNGRGKVWRHVDNTRIPYLKVERIISPPVKK